MAVLWRRPLKFSRGPLLLGPTSIHLFYVPVMLLVDLLDVIDAFPEDFSVVSNEICRLQRPCASRCALKSGICRLSFFLTSA